MAVANAWPAPGHSAVSPPLQLPLRLSSPCSPESLNYLHRKTFLLNSPNKILSAKTSRYSNLIYCCTSNNRNTNYGDLAANNINSSSSSSSSSSSVDWDWNRWSRHFSEIEQAENYVSVLKFQLEDAIENEDFEEAAKLKKAIAEATSKDNVAEIMQQLQNAVEEERYNDAARISRSSASGLVGWWVGYSKDSADPFGRLIRITPGTGRFIGKSYSPRQLVTSAPGTPLFEIFVVKDANGTYNIQVVFLKQMKGNSTNSSPTDKSTNGPSTGETENESVVDVKLEESDAEKYEGKSIDVEGAAEEGIKSVINFLREKIPELKVKVMRVDVDEDISEDAVKEFMEEDDETTTSDDSEKEGSDLDNNQPDIVSAQEDSNTIEDENNLDMKLYIGGVLHNKEDTPVKEEFVRVPADLKDMEKDSFVLHIPMGYLDNNTEENIASNVKFAAIAAQGVSELMPPEVAKAFYSSEKVPPKVSRDVREIVKLAVSQAQKRSRLSEYTYFSRITTSKHDLDPFEGLYVGAFGPYGTEVVQLRRKYGNWKTNNDESSDMEFFEYIEAVKLTGDLNVPAGQVTFRVKVGKGSRLANRGMYPAELGVVASYKGQGRIAEFGFQNPKWVEGELLQLNGKGFGPYIKGADLGFLYVVPEQSFLVLFNRLRLPEE